MLSPEQTMGTCKVEDCPRSPHGLSSPSWSPPEFKSLEVPLPVIGPTSKSNEYIDTKQWHEAMLCKEHVGTSEWVNCVEDPCVKLRKELCHLLECPYKLVGGCKEQCIPLKEELRKFRELQPKYPTISHSMFTKFAHRQHDQQERIKTEFNKLGCDVIQAKLHALTTQECVSTTVFSPSTPVIDEPFYSQLSDESVSQVVQLIPLDKTKLSVANGCFRKNHEWEKVSYLSQGTFGKTYLCYDKKNASHFAIKKVPISQFNMEEIEIWERLSSQQPNIVNLYGAVKCTKYVLIFMEYMKGGCVGDYLAKNGPFNEKCALHLLQQVLRGLDFMHRKYIVHGDIKAANVLMDDMGIHVKLADFGSCVDLGAIELAKNTDLSGTLVFMAPEICRSEFPSTSADIWSTMCFLVQMISGKPPWAEYLHVSPNLRFIIGSAKRAPQLPSCSEAMKEMFAQGFHVEARSRPSAAELLMHHAFPSDDTSMELSHEFGDENVVVEEEDNSTNDGSLDYHSSPSPLIYSDFSDDEYFSSTDVVDNPSVFALRDETLSPKDKTDSLIRKRLESKGGHFSTTDTCCNIDVPNDALQNTTQLSVRCIDPVHFYQPLIDSGLYGNVKILGHVHQLLPEGQTFLQPVTVNVTVSEALHQSEDHTVIHGHSNETKNDITWEDITYSSRVLPFEQSTTIKVTLRHFSYLLALKSTLSLAQELFLTYFNSRPMLFRFMVLIRPVPSASDSHDVRLVALRESFYVSSGADKYSICRSLEDDGFQVLYGKRTEYLYPEESLTVSLRFEHGRCRGAKTFVAKCSFGGEEVGQWTLNGSAIQGPLSGSVILTRSNYQVYRFQFWEHEPTRYVQGVLKLDTLAYVNVIPIAKAVGLDEQEITELVEKTLDEEEQLKEITECWQRKAGNHELASMEEFITRVSKQAILVSDRGKFHLGLLHDFKDKWDEKRDRDEKIEENDLFFRFMAKSGVDLCQSVFSDCLLEIDQSGWIDTANDNTFESLEKLLRYLYVREINYPNSAYEKLKELLELLKPDEVSLALADAAKSQNVCRHLARCVPWLVQVVKDLFQGHGGKPLTGMWGILSHEVDESTKTAEEKLPSNEVWCQICELLRKLCERNRAWITDDADLDLMEKTLDVFGLLQLLSMCDEEWISLAARVQHFRRLSKEITRNNLSRILSQNLQNVLQWLQRFVKFCPTRLVQFTFLSLSTAAEEGQLWYDHDSRLFTQSLTLTEDIPTVVDLKLQVHIRVNGCQYRDVVEVSLKMMKAEESNAKCVTLSVVYEHSDDGTGSLKILNESQQCLFEKPIDGNESNTDGKLNEEKPPESEIVKYKEGSPSLAVLEEISREIPTAWKQLARELLPESSGVLDGIEEDVKEVAERGFRSLQTWKQACGSSATYCVLYRALCKVARKDLAEKYCLENAATVL